MEGEICEVVLRKGQGHTRGRSSHSQVRSRRAKSIPRRVPVLGAAQSSLGYKVLDSLPTLNNREFFEMYNAMNLWLQGDNVGYALGVKERPSSNENLHEVTQNYFH